MRERLVIDLGGKQVEIVHFGFVQAPGDIAVWLPQDKTLWVGNMIQAPPPIIPGHNKPMTREQISFSVMYLEQLSQRVQEAREEGLTLEETIQRVNLPEYRQYRLFDFAHKQVNIPAVYHDLKQER